MKPVIILAAVFVVFLSNAAHGSAQTTSFTHHGNVGFSVTTTYDFRFALYDTPAVGTGTQQGLLVDKQGISVTNGEFTVTGLDFGATVFTGGELFLEAAWSPAGSGTFTTLSSREKVTAVYANRSVSAATADNATQLGGLPTSGFIQNTTQQQAGTSFNIGGDGTAGGTLSGNTVNTATQYNIGGARVLSNPGNQNLFAGWSAGSSNASGYHNSFFGSRAGASNTGGFVNSFFGSQAGLLNRDGSNNSFFGVSAGYSNTSASWNSFFGSEAGWQNSAGAVNAFFGGLSGNSNTMGSGNVFVGYAAGNANTLGNSNIFLGTSAGAANTIGNANTIIGDSATLSANNLSNATAIGSHALVGQSNSLVLGSINGFNGAAADTKVGIGTTAPSFRLHVIDPSNTGLRVQTNIAGGQLASFGGNGDFQIDAPGIVGGRFIVKESGSIGIGTTAPRSKLDVSGTGVVRVRVNSDSNAGLALTLLDQPWWSVAATSGGNFRILNDTTGLNAVWIDANNNVGINTTSPQARLDVSGFIRANFNGGGSAPLCRNDSGQIAWCSSSLRYKTNIAPFHSGLNLVNRLQPITFNWKASGEADLGLGAEDVAKVEPLLVTHNEKGQIEGVKYDRIAVVLLNAVKEQQAQIETLKRIVCLDHPNADLCEAAPRTIRVFEIK